MSYRHANTVARAAHLAQYDADHAAQCQAAGRPCPLCGAGAVHPAYDPSSSRLFTAIKHRKRGADDVRKKVADVLDAGVSVNARDKVGRTPLYVAAEMDDVPLCEMLLSRGADLEATTVQGETLLHGAAAVGSLRACTWLLDHGVDAQALTVDGRTALFHAAYKSGVLCRLLLSRGVDVHVLDISGFSALHAAAENGIVDACQAILDAGANPNVADTEGYATPLHLAAQGGHTSTCRLLIERGADMTRRSVGGNTPFTTANNYGHTATMEEFVRCGMDVNGRLDGVPLLLVILHNVVNVPNDSGVRILLQAGADPLQEDEEGGGMSALLDACSAHESDVPTRVLEYFFTVTGRSPADYDRVNPAFHVIHATAVSGSLAKVQLVVRLGANPRKKWNARGGFFRVIRGATAEVVAQAAGHRRVAAWLREAATGHGDNVARPQREANGDATAGRVPRRGGGRARRRHGPPG